MRLSKNFTAVVAFAAIALSACAGPRRTAEPIPPYSAAETRPANPGSSPEVAGPPAPYGPQSTPPAETFGPEPIQLRPVILVLGPGWARSFAHVGVLRALHESKIPIAGIISTELGALVGAAYSNSRTIHEFEWSMLKLKSELFTVKGNLLGSLFGKASNGKDLEDAIETLFGAKELRDGRVPTRVLIQSPPGAAPTIIDSGPISKILRAASAIPGWMKPGDWNGSPAYSAGQQRPFPVSEARLMGSGPVIVIDVMDRAAIPAGKTAPEAVAYFKQAASTKIPAEADLIIRPDLRGIGYDQFDKRTEIVFSGKKAALSELARIKHLVGLP